MKRTAVGLAAVAALGVAVLVPATGQSQGLANDHAGATHAEREGRGPAAAREELAGDLVIGTSTPPHADGAPSGIRHYLSCT